MKANELMVDDYIRIKSTKQIIKLTEIDSAYDEVSYFDGEAEGELTIKLSNIEPIELTPEILEKNGYYDGELHGRDKFDVSGLVLLRTDNEYDVIKFCVIDYDDLNPVVFITIHYVHELQHALKLCGIEKTIEL